MSESDKAFRDEIEESLVEELYARSRTSFAGLALVLVLLRVLLDPVFRRVPALAVLFFAAIAILALRVVLVVYARRKQGFFASARRRHVAFGVGSTLTAIALCAINLVAFPHLDAVQVATLAVCHTGINAIALMSIGSSPILYHLYMLPILGPLVVLSAIGPYGSSLRLMPVMIVLYMTILSVMALHEYRSRRDNILLRLRVAEMALVDALTGLRNRRYVQEFMSGEVEQVLRDWSGDAPNKRKLWLMIVDLDHFKEVNDRHGHDAGDAVLKQVGALLRDTARRQDVIARWGGEEFVVVARDVDGGNASALAERLREKVAAHAFVLPGGETIHRTCSIGYSVFPFVPGSPRALAWDDVLALADAGLYRAKEQGRNRVIGILSGETASSKGRAAVDEVKSDVERARESGIVRLVG